PDAGRLHPHSMLHQERHHGSAPPAARRGDRQGRADPLRRTGAVDRLPAARAQSRLVARACPRGLSVRAKDVARLRCRRCAPEAQPMTAFWVIDVACLATVLTAAILVVRLDNL